MGLLLAWLCLLLALNPGTSWNAGFNVMHRWLQTQPQQVLAMVLGLEGSVWLHLILDGDPLPVEWGRSRRQ